MREDIHRAGGLARAGAPRNAIGQFFAHSVPSTRVDGLTRYRLKAGGQTSNMPEIAAISELEDDGWMVLKKGWPDLLAVKDGKIRLLEIKPTAGRGLSGAQQAVAAVFKAYLGITVELYAPSQQAIQQASDVSAQQAAFRSRERSNSTSSSSTTLKSLPSDKAWWDALAKQYSGVDLHTELLKALDWHRADGIKNPKLFFRNWVERAYRTLPHEDTYELGDGDGSG